MPDMLVKLYNIEEDAALTGKLVAEGIKIKKVLTPDKHRVIDFIKENFGAPWASECETAFCGPETTCYIAVKDKAVIGFGCYDCTAKGYFGPTGVKEEFRGKGIGKALLLKCLLALWESGYGYAIIGGVRSAKDFYAKNAGAVVIEDSYPGVYKRMINLD